MKKIPEGTVALPMLGEILSDQRLTKLGAPREHMNAYRDPGQYLDETIGLLSQKKQHS